MNQGLLEDKKPKTVNWTVVLFPHLQADHTSKPFFVPNNKNSLRFLLPLDFISYIFQRKP